MACAAGQAAYLLIALMVAAGVSIMVVVERATGGPFLFAVNEFLISNIVNVLCFGGLALWALRSARNSGWHRRLMLVAMAVLTGPGIGRLLPMPLLVPNAWTIAFLVTLIFPAIAMVADIGRHGQVHPAYRWGMGVYVGTFIGSMMLIYSPLGYALTERVIAGTPGAERRLAAFIPPM